MKKTIRPSPGKRIIECANGNLSINFSTGEQQFYKAKQPRKSAINYNHRAAAPQWEEFILQAFAVNADPLSMVDHFHRFLGWLMFPTRANKINWILWGHERSGKYQLLNIAAPLLAPGKYDDLTLTNRNPRLTGQWLDQYRKMAIPFDRIFSEAELDPVHMERIAQHELPGILNLVADGLSRLITDGFGAPAECEAALEKWDYNRGQFERFMDEKCAIRPNSGGRIFGSELYSAYMEWRDKSGEFIGKKNSTANSENSILSFNKRHPMRRYSKTYSLNAESSFGANHRQMSA